MFPVILAQIKQWEDYNSTTQQGCIVDGVPTLKCFEVVFGNLVFAASSLIMLALFVMLVVGGFNYLTSLGSPEKVKKAQDTFKYALIGFILFISAYVILSIIDFLFLGGQGQIFRFSIGEDLVPGPGTDIGPIPGQEQGPPL